VSDEGSTTMHARIGTWHGTAEDLDRWATRSQDDVVPQVLAVPGAKGVLLLLDRDGGSALTLTLWESEEALQASEERRAALQAGTTAASGARVETSRYEVVAFDYTPA
jgi:heme-degrading monooxygenase HmoA